jgi:hypothetical protein
MDLTKELADLAKADRDIFDGVARIARMRREVENLRAKGRSTVEVGRTIQLLEEMLDAWRAHRNTIARVIANAPTEKPPRKRARRTRNSTPI